MKNVLSSAVNVQFIYSQINSLLASSDSSNAVLAALHSCGGVATSAALQMQLGLSQPTVSRALAPLIRSGDVRALGAARSRFYLLPRSIDGVGREVPIMRVDAHGRRLWLDEADGVSQPHDGLPWFLNDMKLQGFMGRTFAHARSPKNTPRRGDAQAFWREVQTFGQVA